jgi:DHA1 family multidrug resistance protein-like MFS transporter
MAPKSGPRMILADRSVATVVGLAFLILFGAGLVLPVLPLYASSFGVGYGGAGLLVASYSLARLVCDLGAGLVVDRWGERTSGAAGLALTTGGALVTGLAPTFPLALVFWATAGAGSAVVFAAMYSYLLKVVPKERMGRTLSFFYGAFNGGVIAGSLLGGIVASQFGLASPLFFMAGATALATLLYVRLLPAERPASRAPLPALADATLGGPRGLRRSVSRLARVARTPGFGMVMVTNLAYLWMVAALYDTLLPLFARDELLMSTLGIGVVFSVALAAEFLVLYPAGSLSDRRGRRYVLLPSLAALAGATVAVGWANSPVALAGIVVLLGIASGFAGVPPAAMLADVIPEHQSGTGVGIFRFSGDLGFTLGPLVAGFTASTLGFQAAFAIVSLPTVAAFVLVARGQETLTQPGAADVAR